MTSCWAGEWPQDPGDEEILRRAHQESRVLVTLDKDFGELAIVRGQVHSGIVRLVALSAQPADGELPRSTRDVRRWSFRSGRHRDRRDRSRARAARR